MKKFISLALITVLLFTLPLVAGCDKKGSSELTKITLSEVAHSIFYAPQYAAIELGYFEEEGIALTLVNDAGADNVMTSLISKDADIGFMGSEASIYVYSEGNADYAVNFAQLTQRAGNFLVARQPIENFSWDMLKGKNVLGGRDGGMPEMVFEYILMQNGINPDTDVNIDKSINFGLTAAAFTGGDADFTVEFEPFATSLEMENEGCIVASLGVDSGYVPYTSYCALKSYFDSHENVISGFTRAIQKGLDYVNSHTSKEIATVISTQFAETDIDKIATIVERYKNQDTWKKDTVFEKDSFEHLEDILIANDSISKKVPYEDLVTTKYSKDAAK